MIIDIGAGNNNVNFKKGGGASVKVEDNKSVTYTANGTFEIAPSDGYDAIKGAEVKVEVSEPIEKFVVPDGMKFSNSQDTFFDNHFDFTSVNDWSKMFMGAQRCDVNLGSIVLKGSLANMFNQYRGDIDLSLTVATNVTDMGGMFYYANIESDLDLSKFDTSQVANMNNIFYYANCKNLNLSGWDLSAMPSANNNVAPDFYKANITNLNLSVPKGKENSWGSGAFPSLGCTISGKLNVDNWKIKKRKLSFSESPFSGCTCDEIDITSWTFDGENDSLLLFMGSKIKNILADNLDLSGVYRISASGSYVYDKGLFAAMSAANTISAKNWNLSDCERMTAAFYQNNASVIDVSGWVTSACTDMRAMFQACKNITTLDLSSFDTSKVSTMRDMFFYCTSLSALDLSNFDCSSLNDMTQMFEGCSKLSNLVISSKFFSSSALTTYDFSGATNWTEATSLATLVDALPQLTASKTIKLSTATKNALTDGQKTTITDKGWTIA